MERYANITVRPGNEQKRVKITSSQKPYFQDSLISKWQTLIDTAARIVGVPSGLIMQLQEETIEVFLKSKTSGNPYHQGEAAKLIYGLYCETVIGTQEKLLVPDATKSDIWGANNPDVEIDMISYLGFPVNWPDGEVFGTVCLLDRKENHYSEDYEDLLQQVKQHLESDLEILTLNDNLAEQNEYLQAANQTKSTFISLISHDVRGNIGNIKALMGLMLDDLSEADQHELKTYLESMHRSLSVTHETLNNLMEWAKSDLVHLTPVIEPVNIVSKIRSALSFFEQNIKAKNLSILETIESEYMILNTDENMVDTIIRNILSNAIKHSYKQGDIRIAATGSNNNQIKVEIEDYGTGMNATTAQQLFSYNHNHSTGTAGENSAGIGLMLTKEFADKINANLEVQSEEGKGTTITITLKGLAN